MNAFLQKFAVLVAGVLLGFDRVVFKGKLRELYAPSGMNILLGVNHVRRGQFKAHAAEITQKVMAASLVAKAKELDRYRYLNSSTTDKEKLAREMAQRHDVREGLVCVLHCVEPCWTFDTKKMSDGTLTIGGERGKCSHLYHYYIHPLFGWMYVRLQTWFPFEFQIGINGLRVEMTINAAKEIKAFRKSNSVLRPDGEPMWRNLRQSVEDIPQRVTVGERANNRYLGSLATLAETQPVRELAEPLTRRVPEPAGRQQTPAVRFVRGLNPLQAKDARLLAVISDPKWMVQGLRNRDLVAALYGAPAKDDKENRSRSSRITRLLRMLRGHGLLEKIAGTHRYQVAPGARNKIHCLLALQNANAKQLTTNAA